MSLPLITAVAPRWEVDLAAALARAQDVQVVRRCADVAELLGVAAAGAVRISVLSSDLRGLDRDVVDQVRAHEVQVLGVHPPGDEAGERLLRRWGVREVLPADVSAQDLDAAVQRLLEAGEEQAGTTGPIGQSPVADDPADERRTHGPRTDSTEADRGGHPDGQHAWQIDGDGRRPDPMAMDRPVVGEPPPEPMGHGPLDATGDSERMVSPVEPVHQGGGVSHEVGPGAGTGGRRGRVIVVWGPAGSPGRTTVAVNLAAELADPSTPCLLVDADTYAASVGQVLGVLDEVPGVALAARAADHGDLDPTALSALAPEVRPGLRVLTGLPRPERWPELRDVALADVLDCCARLGPWTVVDVAPFLEQDEELSFDTLAPRRNGATLTALAAADLVVAVGTADPVGLQRLVRGLDALAAECEKERHVVVTRVRPGPIGRYPGRQVADSLRRFADVPDVHLVPEDHDSLDAALLLGATLCEARPRSPARIALRQLADRLAGRDGPQDRAGGRMRRRGRHLLRTGA